MFSGCTVLPDSKENELGSSDQEVSPSAGKNTRVVLVPCSCMEVRPCNYFRWCGYFWGPWVSFVTTYELSVRVPKNYFKDWCLTNSRPTFKSHNSLKLNFTNIRGLRSNFVDCEPFFQSNSPDILALCETNLDDWNNSGNFSVSGYLPLIRKDSSTHIHDLAVYVKEGLPLARTYP